MKTDLLKPIRDYKRDNCKDLTREVCIITMILFAIGWVLGVGINIF